MSKSFKCKVCGAEIDYCSACVVVKNPIYEEGYCNENCKSIWDILCLHGTLQASAKETAKALKKVQVPSTLTGGIQGHIDMIFNEVKASQPKAKVAVSECDDNKTLIKE